MESRGPTRILWNETAGELSGENAERGMGVYRAEPMRAQSGGSFNAEGERRGETQNGGSFSGSAPQRLSGVVGHRVLSLLLLLVILIIIRLCDFVLKTEVHHRVHREHRGRDAPPGRPRPARAGRSGATCLPAFPKAFTRDDIQLRSVRLAPDGDVAFAFALASVGRTAGRPYLPG